MTRRKILQQIGEKGILAIKEAERQSSNRLLDSEPLDLLPWNVLAETFNWHQSSQGYEFWADVQKEIFQNQKKR